MDMTANAAPDGAPRRRGRARSGTPRRLTMGVALTEQERFRLGEVATAMHRPVGWLIRSFVHEGLARIKAGDRQ